jgi:ligand-binding sensor protein
MTSRTERCVGLVRSGKVAEGACRIGLHAISTPLISSVWWVGFVECGINQMDYKKYEEDSCLHNKVDERRL